MAVKKDSTVTINFTGKLEDGSIFDSTNDDCGCGCDDDSCEDESCCNDNECDEDGCCDETGPFTFTLGTGAFFSSVEEALVGMEPGEKKSLTVKAVDGFGEYDEEMVFSVPKADLPEGMDPEVGLEYVLTNDEDEEMGVVVVEMDEDSVTFDANHPLAGEELYFDIELVSIA